jgi:Polyketide cyclase / dehydrase and lipid transport
MGPALAAIEIDLPRQPVFDRIADLSARPAFTDHFLSGFHLTRIDSSGVGAGARFHHDIALLGIWMDTTIVDAEPPQRILERGSGGRGNRIAATTVWELTEGPGSLTRVRLSFWTEPSNTLARARELLGAAAPRYERRWATALRRLRDQLESGASPERLGVAGGSRSAIGVP